MGLQRPIIIAIDGPAASGKSTVARRLAERLGWTFLDTGAMYRAVTLIVRQRGLAPSDEEACRAVAEELDLSFDERGRILVDGRPAEPAIRAEEVTRDVSTVAAHAGVRRALVEVQRRVARGSARGVVAEGRDVGTVVFPDADHKFFLNASSRERARRRARQEGRPDRVDEIQRRIDARDELDSTRLDSPLRRAEDAIEVATDERTVEEVLEVLRSHLGAVPRGSE